MEKIKLQVSASQIQVVQRPAAITAGTVGLEAEFSFDSHWDNLGKTVIFRAGDKVITAGLEGDTHIVPWEVLEKPDLWLIVGVYGANPEGTVVIPTLWTKVAAVYTGVDPEGDPGLEPSNPIWQQTLARVTNMEPQLSEHISNTENPHCVTCDKIGAVTQKEFRDVVSNLDGSGDPEGLIPHLLNRENPHGVTAAQAGAALAGFGLGETLSRADNWNAGFYNAFSRSNQNSPDGKWWYGLTCREQTRTGTTTEIAFSVDSGNLVFEARRSRNSASVWGQWEYVNPPMLEGVEYRTTERFNGRPVYAQLFNCGTLPNASYKEYIVTEATKSNIIDVVRFDGYLEHNGDYSDKIPISNCKSLNIVFYGDNRFRITTTTNESSYDATVVVYYTLSE